MKLFGASSFCATENFDFQKLKLITTGKFSFEKQKSFAKHIGKKILILPNYYILVIVAQKNSFLKNNK